MPSARENADVEQKAGNASVLSGMNGLASMVAISTKGTGAPKNREPTAVREWCLAGVGELRGGC
jgi:hypothetical protein